MKTYAENTSISHWMTALLRYNRKDQIVVMMNEWSERACFLSLQQPNRLYLPVSMLQWWPSKVHASITMAMTWNWKENKVGRHKQTKKDKGREATCRKTQPNIYEHKQRSKPLFLGTTELKGNEKQHNMWICKCKLIEQNLSESSRLVLTAVTQW